MTAERQESCSVARGEPRGDRWLFTTCCRRRVAVVVVVVVCLMTPVILYFYTFTLPGRGDTSVVQGAAVQAVTAASSTPTQAPLDPLARSTALRQHVRDVCRTLKFPESVRPSKETLSHLIYDDKHQAIYCFIPKVACTSWKKVFLKMTGVLPPQQNISSLTRKEVHSRRLPLLANSKDAEEKLKTYKKFMFVRPPFDRVLAAYKDKFERKDELWDFHKYIGTKISKKYRGTTAGGGHNITFHEFIRFISEPGRGTPEQRNEHWLPMHELCDPCSLNYDFIGKKEHLDDDGDNVLRWLGVTDLVDKFPSATKPVNASEHVLPYLKQLDHKEIMAFYAKYLPDYLLFDYQFL